MSGPLFDCYVMAPRRSGTAALDFLAELAPQREPLFAASDPTDVVGSPAGASEAEVFRYLESRPDLAYAMYWQTPTTAPPQTVLVSFTADGHLIFGVAACSETDPLCADTTLKRMRGFTRAVAGFIGVEAPPPFGRAEFMTRARR